MHAYHLALLAGQITNLERQTGFHLTDGEARGSIVLALILLAVFCLRWIRRTPFGR